MSHQQSDTEVKIDVAIEIGEIIVFAAIGLCAMIGRAAVGQVIRAFKGTGRR